jgi:general nucleoside transport system permease protein
MGLKIPTVFFKGCKVSESENRPSKDQEKGSAAQEGDGKRTEDRLIPSTERLAPTSEEESREAASTDPVQAFISETNRPTPGANWRTAFRQIALVPLLAVLTGLLIGGVFIILTTEEVYMAFGEGIGVGLSTAWWTVANAYTALFVGSIGDLGRIIAALGSGDALEIRRAFNPFLESLVATTPYIFAGLGVALGFRAGVFNIGAEGQIFMGAVAATWAGYAITGMPAIIHIPLALLAGAVGGGVWGFIPGWLKAKTGAHEVINSIMMNYIAFRLSDWLLTGPMKRPGSFNPVSPNILPTAVLPRFFGDPIRFHLGFFIALAIAWLVYWLLFKTTWGFDLRTVGANAFAARYAGMKVPRNIMLAMALSGSLAGLAGANEVLGVNYNLAMAFSSGYGFDAIALALLGGNHPLGVVLSALLFGTLRNGATRMQVVSQIPNDIISILQAIILALIAAPAIIRTIYRLRSTSGGANVQIQSWGGK